MKNASRLLQKKSVSKTPRRPPPVQQQTLEEAVSRLSLRGVTSRRMFGGLCYYVNDKPFALLLGEDLALKLPAAHLRKGCDSGDGRVFNPGGGDFLMREYLALSGQALTDEAQVDAYVLASYRFLAGDAIVEEQLRFDDLRSGRDGLYRRTKKG